MMKKNLFARFLIVVGLLFVLTDLGFANHPGKMSNNRKIAAAEERQDRRENRQENRQERREMRQENREDRRKMRRENRQERREGRKGNRKQRREMRREHQAEQAVTPPETTSKPATSEETGN